MTTSIPQIPITDIGEGGAADLLAAHSQAARQLIETALSTHPLLPRVAPLADRLSRAWLERQQNPYLQEIQRVAEGVALPGVYFLNIIYEWACSTSAGPDPSGTGARLIRVLDWGLSGIGRHVVLARAENGQGPFYSATWPGYAGVLTAMAPGRFAAAINQAPRLRYLGPRWADEVIGRVRFLGGRPGMPAAHLLRQVFERAADYAGAVALLMDEGTALAMPALFTLSGIRPGEACVIEALGTTRRLHPATEEDGLTIGVANDWLSHDLAGVPRPHAVDWSPEMSPRENNRLRRSAVCALQRGAFGGAADLAPPVLNSHTVLVASANAATGEMVVEALDPVPGAGLLPAVTARRALHHVT